MRHECCGAWGKAHRSWCRAPMVHRAELMQPASAGEVEACNRAEYSFELRKVMGESRKALRESYKAVQPLLTPEWPADHDDAGVPGCDCSFCKLARAMRTRMPAGLPVAVQPPPPEGDGVPVERCECFVCNRARAADKGMRMYPDDRAIHVAGCACARCLVHRREATKRFPMPVDRPSFYVGEDYQGLWTDRERILGAKDEPFVVPNDLASIRQHSVDCGCAECDADAQP